ncbi:maltose O-acetyltransferase/hypothetical protein [Nocardioides alpinus]|uniref:Maltose O-acetyltransferase n=1 Tax=Nocardioides alpinus TaxID=748909 RepID=A0A1I0W398_9ACTN|nr:acyltransferase [Nocardioides alpinus]SFA83199.1 maltose O-acetyltransferase/hypothetical protein [Nocardioides alpinus]
MKERHELPRRLWNNGRWDLISTVVASRLVPAQLRRAVLRVFCDHIGAARILGGLSINNRHLVVGDNVFINEDVMIDCNVPVVIEDGVAVGPRCSFITSGHLVGPPEMRRRSISYGEIHVGRGSWLATGVTVLPGVTIGPGCIVAAGAVVHSDCEPDGLYAGVPARRIKDLPTGPRSADQAGTYGQ